MNRLLLIFLFISSTMISQNTDGFHTTRQGQVAFFSYTAVENIEAVNNQVVCVLNTKTGEINASILMRAFEFRKTLMRDHFNESYIESDLYPKATFSGLITDFDSKANASQTRIITGLFTLRDKEIPLTFKVKIDCENKSYTITGVAETLVKHYGIKIPKLLTSNIAKNIQISFNFELTSYEE